MDINSREILADALNDYTGTICLITHDRSLIRHVANKIIDIEDGYPVVFEGDYDNFLINKKAKTAKENIVKQGKPTLSSENLDDLDENNSGKFSPKPGRGSRGVFGDTSKNLSREAKKVSRRINEINTSLTEFEELISQIEMLFSNPDNFDDPVDLVLKGQEYEALKVKVQELWNEWETLSSRADEIDSQRSALFN